MRSTTLVLSLLLLAPETPAQTTVNLGHQSRNVDFSQAPFTRPVKTGSSLPAACTVGELYFHMGMEAGKNLYGCTAPGTWTLLGGDALPSQGGHGGKLLRTDGSTAAWTASLALPPSSVQIIDSAGDSITADALNVRISPDNNYTLTSAPTIADGADGQLLLISNNSPGYSVTLQDEANLLNSNLRLGGSNVTIGPRGSLLLTYNAALASWIRADIAGGASLVLATQEEAENGIENTHYMSPLRSAQAITAQCALPSQSGHEGKVLRTDGSTAAWTASLALPPSSVQIIDSAGDSITADALNVRISPDNNYTLTSAPTIADGVDGQLLLISNNSPSYSVTLQDEANLLNSNLRLGGSNVTIGPRGSLLLTYNAALASWIRADTGGGGSGGGISSLNGQTGSTQTFSTGASGADFNISSSGGVHTFNLPDASDSARGLVSTAAQTFAGRKTFSPTSGTAGLNVGSATSDPTAPVNGDLYYNSSTQKFRCHQNGTWSDCIGGGGTRTDHITFQAANCQMGAASTGFALPSSNYPTATCATGSNSNYGTLSFAENGAGAAQSIQYHFPLPADWTGAIDVGVRWRSEETSGNVVWQVQTACVADGETGDPAWNTAQAFPADAAKATAWQWNDVTLTGLATTGCAAGEELLFKFFRDATDAEDTLAGAAELIWLRFTVRRTQ